MLVSLNARYLLKIDLICLANLNGFRFCYFKLCRHGYELTQANNRGALMLRSIIDDIYIGPWRGRCRTCDTGRSTEIRAGQGDIVMFQNNCDGYAGICTKPDQTELVPWMFKTHYKHSYFRSCAFNREVNNQQIADIIRLSFLSLEGFTLILR